MKITIDIPETWKQLKEDKGLSWRYILRIGIRQLEENNDVYKQSGNKGDQGEDRQITL
jgi:hypothetical protein